MPAIPEAESSPSVAAKDALQAFYARNSLPADGGSAARRWSIDIAGLSIPLVNFAWRSRALPVHDLHHLLTGYPCSPSGEFEMAAWEFAAGRYPHPGATAFCLPLVGMGALLRPRRTFLAFVRGRGSRTLYGQGLTPQVLGASIGQLRHELLPERPARPSLRDGLAYSAWVLASLTWMLGLPALAAYLLLN